MLFRRALTLLALAFVSIAAAAATALQPVRTVEGITEYRLANGLHYFQYKAQAQVAQGDER